MLVESARGVLAAGSLFSGLISPTSSEVLIEPMTFPPTVHRLEQATSCKPTTIIYADGLGGEPSGLFSREFFKPIIKSADNAGIKYKTALAENLADPEKDQWNRAIKTQIKEAVDHNEEVILMGYSMGSRAMLELAASILDQPELITHIKAFIFIAGRDNDIKHAKNYNLPNYPRHYVLAPGEEPPKPVISEQDIQRVKDTFQGKIWVFSASGDQIVPHQESERLSWQIGGKSITVPANSHFADADSGVPIANLIGDLGAQGCQ